MLALAVISTVLLTLNFIGDCQRINDREYIKYSEIFGAFIGLLIRNGTSIVTIWLLYSRI